MLKWLVVVAVIWAAWKLFGKPKKPRPMSRVAPPGPKEQDANELLGVGMHSSVEAVRDAYRQKIVAAHPDRGGSRELAQELGAARDLLLRIRGVRS